MRWVTVLAIAGLLVGTGAAYADTASAGTLANFSGVSWGTVTVPDPANDDVDGGSGQDGRDIYEGLWWVRTGSYDYFRMDLKGAPHDTEYDWAVVYGVYMDGISGQGAPGTDSYVPKELSGIDFIVDWHPDPASVSQDDLLDPSTSGNQFHWHVWNQGAGTWSSTDLASTEYWVSFDDSSPEGPGDNTIQWRIARSEVPVAYYFTGASHDLASANPTTFDLTEPPFITPEPATTALIGLGIVGLAAFRRRMTGT